jgi:HEAT repeat protein
VSAGGARLGARLAATPPGEARVDVLAEISALDAVSARADDTLGAALLGALDDPSPRVVVAALEAAGALGHRGVVFAEAYGVGTGAALLARTLALLDHPEGHVRSEAAVALVLSPGADTARVLEALLARVKDPEVRVRREVLAALGDLGSPSARMALREALERDPDEEARFEAAFALAALGDVAGLDTLIRALANKRRMLDAAEGLRRLGDPSALAPLRRFASKLMLGWAERLTLWGVMYTLGDLEAGARVVARTRAWGSEERHLAVAYLGTYRVREGVPVLDTLARDPKSPLRETALRALAELDLPEARATLVALAADGDLGGELRAIVADALRVAEPS